MLLGTHESISNGNVRLGYKQKWEAWAVKSKMKCDYKAKIQQTFLLLNYYWGSVILLWAKC